MDRPALPRPVTPGDKFLHDIATSLRTLVDRGDTRPEDAIGDNDEIDLLEPAAARERSEPAADDGHVCDQCGKHAKSAAGLAAHARTHDG